MLIITNFVLFRFEKYKVGITTIADAILHFTFLLLFLIRLNCYKCECSINNAKSIDKREDRSFSS